MATVTGAIPPARFGALELDGTRVVSFQEKPKQREGFVNAGYFVLSRNVIDYVGDDLMPWEREPMRRLAAEGQMRAYLHDGFWHPMDTLRDKNHLDELANTGTAPWMVWEHSDL